MSNEAVQLAIVDALREAAAAPSLGAELPGGGYQIAKMIGGLRLTEAADTISRLTRERDEAHATADRYAAIIRDGPTKGRKRAERQRDEARAALATVLEAVAGCDCQNGQACHVHGDPLGSVKPILGMIEDLKRNAACWIESDEANR